jgi:very-short-patch-repair endonuclease
MWHERTERERRYEKRRDRDLARHGYHVFRFTGKEIMEDPGRVAIEVLGYVTNDAYLDMGEYLGDLGEE